MIEASISAIVPTIGRPASLAELLRSLSIQTTKPREIIIGDASGADATRQVIDDPEWKQCGLNICRVAVSPPNAVRQREAAIAASDGEFLLLLDDDVVLEPDCVEQMLKLLRQHGDVVAVMANFTNQEWPQPTRFWRFYLRSVCNFREGEWQGQVVGPLLRFGYHPVPDSPREMQWLGTGNSLIRRAAFIQAGGFSDFFLHSSTTNEDVDLGLRLAQLGRILLCPAARMIHHQSPAGRPSLASAAEGDLNNRFLVLHRTCKMSASRSFFLVFLYFVGETISNGLGCIVRMTFTGFFARFRGRLRAITKLVRGAWIGRTFES